MLTMSDIKANLKCRECGTPIPHPTAYQTLCDECAKRLKSAIALRPRVCVDCGVTFDGYPKSKRCPACRHERVLRLRAGYRAAERAGKQRKIGETYLCERCGNPYTLTGGLQRYCPDCKDEAALEANRAASREYMRAHRDEQKRSKYAVRYCVICGREITANTSIITCSPECALERRRQRQRAADARRGVGRGSQDYIPTKARGTPRTPKSAKKEE